MTGKDGLRLLKKLHRSSFGGIFDIYTSKRLWKSVAFLLSLFLSATLVLVVSALHSESLYLLIKFILELELSILPNLLGFTLGGFAIIISFGNIDLLKALSKITFSESNQPLPSLFQKIVSVFAWGILMQAFALCFAFVFTIAEFAISALPLNIAFSDNLRHSTNALVLFVVTLMGTYSILLIPSFIINIYGFGQAYHLTFIIDNERMKTQTPDKDKASQVSKSDV